MNTDANESPLFRDALDFARTNWWMLLLGGILDQGRFEFRR